MKHIEFTLKSPVRLIPLFGKSEVKVSTNGDVMISDCAPSEHRVRSVTMLETEKASLKRSPLGNYRTVKIRLHASEATEHEFHRQLSKLFGE